MTQHAELLTPPHNYAIVQLPERKFPGVVFQGDSLHSLVCELEDIQEMLASGEMVDAREDMSYLVERLRQVRDSYIRTLQSRGLGLPFPI